MTDTVRDVQASKKATASAPARGRTRDIALAGLSIALLAVCAWVSIPLGAVPVTLQVFAVVLIALLLDPVPAASAFAGYLLLGAVGLPVFSRMQGGFAVIVGPTGGYLLGFAVGAVVASLLRRALAPRVARPVADSVAALVLIAIVYALGTTQLAFVTGMSADKAVLAGVVPFVVPDLVKAAVAIGIASAIRRALPGRV